MDISRIWPNVTCSNTFCNVTDNFDSLLLKKFLGKIITRKKHNSPYAYIKYSFTTPVRFK